MIQIKGQPSRGVCLSQWEMKVRRGEILGKVKLKVRLNFTLENEAQGRCGKLKDREKNMHQSSRYQD